MGLYLNCRRYNEIRDDGVAALVVFGTRLTSLNLVENEIGEAGTQVLASRLRTNTAITRVDLTRNPVAAVPNHFFLCARTAERADSQEGRHGDCWSARFPQEDTRKPRPNPADALRG